MTTIQLFAHATPASEWEAGPHIIDGHRIAFFAMDDLKSAGYVLVGPATITIEWPEGWDPRAQQIEALKAKKEKLQRDFLASVMAINAQISCLQAIEHTPEAA